MFVTTPATWLWHGKTVRVPVTPRPGLTFAAANAPVASRLQSGALGDASLSVHVRPLDRIMIMDKLKAAELIQQQRRRWRSQASDLAIARRAERAYFALAMGYVCIAASR